VADVPRVPRAECGAPPAASTLRPAMRAHADAPLASGLPAMLRDVPLAPRRGRTRAPLLLPPAAMSSSEAEEAAPGVGG
jgi:hypothetical protein